MRTAIIVGKVRGEWSIIYGGYCDYKQLQKLLIDRKANDLAFPCEHIERLPKKRGYDMYRLGKMMQEPYLSDTQLEPPFITSRYFPNGKRNANIS